MTRLIVIYELFSVVLVPFPFTDGLNQKRRPALVLSSYDFQQKNAHVTLAMITTARHSSWLGDHQIYDLKAAGLPVESMVRQKIFTLDSRLVEKQLGRLSKEDEEQVKSRIRLCAYSG